MLNPQTPIEQVGDETLATFGWNLRENQDAHRRQVDVIETQLQAVRQEFVRRAQLRSKELESENAKKESEKETLLREIMDKLALRNGHTVQDSKATGGENE